MTPEIPLLVPSYPPRTPAPAPPDPSRAPRKKLLRRAAPDLSQRYRRCYQAAFLLLNLWLGGQFYFWVRQFETGSVSSLARPAGVEGWLPIAGMMNLRFFFLTGHVPSLHPAAMFLLLTFLAMAFLFRKAFCSWLCPVGTLSEYLWRAGRKLFRRNFHLPVWLDIPLRGLKYFLLGFFVWAVAGMSAPAIQDFMRSPYGIIADVKMLNFFRFLGETGAIVLAVLALASLLIQNFWCRYLCPSGALLGFAALFSPQRIRRNPDACIDCAKCAKACPSMLPVDKLITIKSAECTGCLECVAVCPAQDALAMTLPVIPLTASPRCPVRVASWATAVGVAVLFLGIVGFAKTSGLWNSSVPRTVYEQLVPNADQAEHPMPTAE